MNKPVSPDTLVRPSLAREFAAAEAVARLAFENDALDCDGAFPIVEVVALHRARLLTASLPMQLGGVQPSATELAGLLRRIGSGCLPLGRLYEGHVNALALIVRYGTAAQAERVAKVAGEGQLFGVWNTDDAQGLKLTHNGRTRQLTGRKVLCSGAGFIARPLITATDESGRRLMVTPGVDDAARADLSRWTAQGMRASATGTVDFTGLLVEDEDIVGNDGDYERQPFFSAGAWRFLAVHQGGMETLFRLLRQHLNRTKRGGDPHQAARLGQAGICVETARLWVERAAEVSQGPSTADGAVAYVNLARLAVERAGLDLLELAHRSMGLQSFMRPHPIERFSRDLSTYLRQPAPDRALTNAAAWILDRGETEFELWS
jgi:alkylation response protein AidB-like acyl-CoA dehydrogenase